MLTTLIVLTVVATASALTYATYAATKDQREINEINNHIAQLNQEIENDKTVVSNFETIQGKLSSAINYLETAQNEFKDGGCAYPHVPFDPEFISCLEKLKSANTNISTEISILNSNIKEYEKTIKERQNRIKEIKDYMAKQDAAMREASKKQHERRG